MTVPKRYYLAEILYTGIPQGYQIRSGDGTYKSKEYPYTYENREYLENYIRELNRDYCEYFEPREYYEYRRSLRVKNVISTQNAFN